MSLTRKRKKELRKLQSSAQQLWDSQQVLVGEASHIAREAARQLGNYSREEVVPTVQAAYQDRVQPVFDRGVKFSRDVVDQRVIPAAGAVVGSALSVWDAANQTRQRLASGGGFELPDAKSFGKQIDKRSRKATKALAARLPEAPRKGIGAGGVIAIILGAAAAVGVLYAAWQTLRADDELWVADDPLRTPDE